MNRVLVLTVLFIFAITSAHAQTPENPLPETDNKTKQEKAVADPDGNISTYKIWFSQVFLGERFSSSYDENGKNEGFKAKNFYGSFTLDTRWEFGPDVKAEEFIVKEMFKTKGLGYGWALIPGVDVKFYSADMVNCDLITDEDLKQKCIDGNNKEITQLKFNDISQAVDASLHLWAPFYIVKNKSVDLALGVKLGTVSRENLDSRGSSLNSYKTIAIKFDYNDFFEADKESKKIKNGMSRFSLEYAVSRMGDYANLGEKTRHIIDGRFRIIEDKPIYLGLEVNKGDGPDSVSMVLSYGFKIENLLPRF